MAPAGHRPYFNYSIVQLEDLFARSQADLQVLDALDRELAGHRNTDKAARLLEKVRQAVLGLRQRRIITAANVETENLAETIGSPSASPAVPKSPSAGERPTRPPLDSAAAGQINALPPSLDLGALPTFAPAQARNEPRAILATWTALESLSPQTYRRPEDLAAGDRRSVAALAGGNVPWGKGERSKPKYQLYYQVVLGSIPMDRATEELVKAFGQDEELGARAREKAAIAAILLDKDGFLLEDNSVAVSSFAWALPLALKLELGALAAWPKIEEKITGKVDEILRRKDKHGKPIPVDLATIDKAYRWLLRQFGLPADLVEPPSFALRVYHYYKAKNPPEVSLLNSFYMNDLAKAAALLQGNSAPAGLRALLGADKPGSVEDLLASHAAIEKAVSPSLFPAAGWPSPGGHPLALLQQAAVNIARKELLDKDGVVAVNGPPGTGKTTLLRDIVAASVLDRAMAMAGFDDPETAFTPSGHKMQTGDAGYLHLYKLDPRLKGHEVLVASSNNKAVENVSRELPARKAIGRSDELNFFRTVSDLVYGPGETEDEEDRRRQEPLETWGMIAAVLGNARNRATFQQRFWWHKDRGLRLYLKAAKGDSVVDEIKDEATGKIIERRIPSIVTIERPPSPQQAKANWRKMRTKLLALKREIDTDLQKIERVREFCLKLSSARLQLAEFEAAISQLVEQRSLAEGNRADTDAEALRQRREHDGRTAEVARFRSRRPGFFSRMFRTQQWREWERANEPLVAAATAAQLGLRESEKVLLNATEANNRIASEIAVAEERRQPLRETVRQLTQEIEPYRATLGDRIVDAEFFARGHEASNLASPWLPDSIHRKREDLFIAAIAVHRAFIDAAAQKVMHNVGALMNVFSAGPPPDEARRDLLGDLWSTLFMTVPLVSTTFASVDKMLGLLPPGSIGWLLIDEAGQALPQAAVGAVMRARRSIIVGDPLQIPPVVTLPGRLNAEICKFFKIAITVWAAPEASAQTLADRASRYQASFRSDQGPRRVGIPLLVHRRCQEPMFGISNRIAYDGQMVHAPSRKDEGSVGAVLGPTKWLDIDGDADTKWCPAEGDVVIALLRKLANAGVTQPDLFIITPFRIVAQEMRRQLKQEKELVASLNIDIDEWTEDRVGTIHTVQGREADTVILILGAPKTAQHGARGWAAGTPNILNVAVSRAKQNFYVVGSYGAWSGVGHARELASLRRARIGERSPTT
ncbi:MAG: helicase [Mesorhizobium sp.]|nr:MAG: helicase [Mesorhizobium sp.]